jgi:orotidine-5'-phosphate decarboxylase
MARVRIDQRRPMAQTRQLRITIFIINFLNILDMTKLQVAIDLLTTEAALELAHKVAPYVDIIELGTPLIKSEGLSVVTAMKTAFLTN